MSEKKQTKWAMTDEEVTTWRELRRRAMSLSLLQRTVDETEIEYRDGILAFWQGIQDRLGLHILNEIDSDYEVRDRKIVQVRRV